MLNSNLIFDLGFHNGDDTDFYLQKGFNVVAVDANPKLVKAGCERFCDQLDQKKLVLLNKAVSDSDGNSNFYIHPNKSDWSSCKKDLAESDGSQAEVISVPTVSFIGLCEQFGTPWYAKIDIEGCDLIAAQQLNGLNVKPTYVSFELSKRDYVGIFSSLLAAGYKKFQLVNQLNHVNRKFCKSNAGFEGKIIDYQFTEYSSGFFGKDLPDSKWLSYADALGFYQKYRELKNIDNQELALGWLDLHASID